MILEFSCQELASMKSFAVKKLIKFDTLETFCFPDEKVQNILQRYMTEKVHICHIPRDMGSTSLNLSLSTNLIALFVKINIGT